MSDDEVIAMLEYGARDGCISAPGDVEDAVAYLVTQFAERDRLMATNVHYHSTACFHELHDRCRRACKFCSDPCQCECHARDASGEGT